MTLDRTAGRQYGTPTGRRYDARMTYEPPAVEVMGTFEELTLGNTTGNQLDASFPIHTPKPDLTFS